MPYCLDSAIFNHLNEGDWVITPNNRLSSDWLEMFFLIKNQQAIAKPYATPLTSLARALYDELLILKHDFYHPFLIDTQVEYYLWQNYLNSQLENVSSGLIHKIQSAWRISMLWDIKVHMFDDNTLTPQQLFFKTCYIDFQNILRKKHLITEAQLFQYLTPYASLFEKHHFVFSCFDDVPPVIETFKKSLSFCQDYQIPIKNSTHHIKLLAAKDEKEELTQLCLWLEDRLKQKHKKIGVILPDIHQSQTVIDTLNRNFPESINISLAEPMSNQPIIAQALWALSLHLSQQDRKVLGQSPFFDMSQWHNVNKYPTKAHPHQWIERFKQRLIDLKFPGEISMGSYLYQSYQKLLSHLDTLLTLEVLKEPISAESALNYLKDSANVNPFQPKNEHKPIQVLGLLESQGIQFESLWVMNLTNTNFPSSSAVNPFISIALQKKLDCPHANPSREIRLAKMQITRLANSANHIVMSYALHQNDAPALASPLLPSNLDNYPLISIPKIDKPELEILIEDERFPVEDPENIKGGTRILANQAKCPFKAFAEHRLHAKPAIQATEGIDPLTRGLLLHKSVEIFWMGLTGQQALKAMEDTSKQSRIYESVMQALTDTDIPTAHLDAVNMDVEKDRLIYLLSQLLDFELSRPDFDVTSLEKNESFSIAGLRLNVRIDRLDTDKDGNQWVIDYKTRIPDKKPWLEEQPEEPQLLLYALLDERINTLLFIGMNKGRITLAGLSETPSDIRGIQSLKDNQTFSEKRIEWHQKLESIAQSFLQGDCQPRPNRESLCPSCDYRYLCKGAHLE